jgi:hypothetical protein
MNSLWDFQDKLKALGHFQTVYTHPDTLCGHFRDQLDQLDRDGFFAALPDTGPINPPSGATSRRDREVAHLNALIDRLAQIEPRYVPLAGEETQEQRLERVLKDLVVPSEVLFEAFGFDPAGSCLAGGTASQAQREPKTYDDVLTAFRDLPRRDRARRLAVLGEPGAGKSFSLGRIACELARAALADPAQPVPVLVALGLWTEATESLDHFIVRASLPPPRSCGSTDATPRAELLPADLDALRRERRLLLLLDAVNEIPPGQRRDKVAAIATLAQDDHLAALLLSCRQRDFEAELQSRLPFDTLRLQPLRPWQVRDFLRSTLTLTHGEVEGERRAEDKFWQIAGGDPVREVWRIWKRVGATFELFWTADEAPSEPDVVSAINWREHQLWRAARSERSLIRLADNPFLLTVMMQLPAIPPNRAQLFAGFLRLLHRRESEARTKRADAASVPPLDAWRATLVQAAEALQRADGSDSDGGARTALARAYWPAALTDELLAFSIDASVLQRVGDELRFTHQLLQESLAADLLLSAARSGDRPASDFWPHQNGWARTGWEVVAEIAAEACAGDTEAQIGLIRWLAMSAPKVATDVWIHAGRPALPADLLAATKAQWFSRMTDVTTDPEPEARMAIGCWLGALDLDDRPGTGLTAAGLPDVDWVVIDDPRPFIYQQGMHPALPPFAIARYPVTNRQWQAFVDGGGYTGDRWWKGLAEQPEPLGPWWSEPTAPRETVSWYEAMAYCRWLSDRLGREVSLPAEQQWERAARGRNGQLFPWGESYRAGMANTKEKWRLKGPHSLSRTTMVGLYPFAADQTGVDDLAGNLWEWCLNENEEFQDSALRGDSHRVIRGGAWVYPSHLCGGACRGGATPNTRSHSIGFRLVVSCPIPGAEP